MSLTTDRNNPDLKVTESSGMQKTYLVLSEEERAKGFVRPIRRTYVHVGRKPNYKGIHRWLDDKEKDDYIRKGKFYVAIMTVLTKEDGSFLGGAYVTQQEFNAWKNDTLTGGCGVATTMGQALAETYARDPKFYGATYCVGCHTHLPVNEFRWEDDHIVGS